MIIGVSGKIASGKDLVGQMVQYIGTVDKPSFEEFTARYEGDKWLVLPNWKVKKFADALKDNVCTLLGVDRDMLEDRDYKEAELGEEWWYYQHADGIKPYGFWKGADKELADSRFLVKPTPRLILQRLGTEGVREIIHPNAWVNAATAGYNGQHWVFTDMRFPNELETVVSRGGVTIRVQRGDGNTGSHPSEIALDDYMDKFDYVIDNNGTMEELYDQVAQIALTTK